MPLNLSVNDGEITPYLKYNAKAGRFYVRPEGEQQEVEIVNPRLAFDMENIRTGWIYYQEGVGPEKVWDPSPVQAAPRPPGSRKFKRGFEVMVFGPDVLPRVGRIGLREFSSTATNVIAAILKMYADYEAQVSGNPNAVPVYQCTHVDPVQGTYGTNYEPVFELQQWVPRSKIEAFNDLPRDHNGTAVVGFDVSQPPPAEPPPAADFDDPIPF